MARSTGAGLLGCYFIRPTAIYARNEGMQAGIDNPSPVSFNVPAEELDTALARMPQVTSLTYTGDALTLKCGRLKAHIKCPQGEPPVLPPMPTTWVAAPPGLTAALKLALPFVAAQGWSASIRLTTDHVTAIRNTCGITITVPGLAIANALITVETAAFLIAQGDPAEFAVDANSIIWRWTVGRWMRSQLVNTPWTPIVEKIFTDAGTDAPVGISDEWRSAWADAAALSDGSVAVTAKALRGIKGASTTEVDIDTPVPADYLAYWATADLNPIVACATAWNPLKYPNAALFIGPNVRGVVIGQRR